MSVITDIDQLYTISYSTSVLQAYLEPFDSKQTTSSLQKYNAVLVTD